jgi:hypothetical protein
VSQAWIRFRITVPCRTRNTRPRSSWRRARVAGSGIQIAGRRFTRASSASLRASMGSVLVRACQSHVAGYIRDVWAHVRLLADARLGTPAILLFDLEDHIPVRVQEVICRLRDARATVPCSGRNSPPDRWQERRDEVTCDCHHSRFAMQRRVVSHPGVPSTSCD